MFDLDGDYKRSIDVQDGDNQPFTPRRIAFNNAGHLFVMTNSDLVLVLKNDVIITRFKVATWEKDDYENIVVDPLTNVLCVVNGTYHKHAMYGFAL